MNIQIVNIFRLLTFRRLPREEEQQKFAGTFGTDHLLAAIQAKKIEGGIQFDDLRIED